MSGNQQSEYTEYLRLAWLSPRGIEAYHFFRSEKALLSFLNAREKGELDPKDKEFLQTIGPSAYPRPGLGSAVIAQQVRIGHDGSIAKKDMKGGIRPEEIKCVFNKSSAEEWLEAGTLMQIGEPRTIDYTSATAPDRPGSHPFRVSSTSVRTTAYWENTRAKLARLTGE